MARRAAAGVPLPAISLGDAHCTVRSGRQPAGLRWPGPQRRPPGGMFRGLSSWLGLQQPVVDGRPVEGDGQPEGEAPPEPRAEAVAESAESELLHQAKDLGGESPVSGWGRKVCPLVGPLGTGELGEDLGKAGASSRSQILNLKWLVTDHYKV